MIIETLNAGADNLLQNLSEQTNCLPACVQVCPAHPKNNGIILGLFDFFLVVGFGGDTSKLIPLYAVGVLLSFTLSQAGIVRR